MWTITITTKRFINTYQVIWWSVIKSKCVKVLYDGKFCCGKWEYFLPFHVEKISVCLIESDPINQFPRLSHYPILHSGVGMWYDSLNALTVIPHWKKALSFWKQWGQSMIWCLLVTSSVRAKNESSSASRDQSLTSPPRTID